MNETLTEYLKRRIEEIHTTRPEDYEHVGDHIFANGELYAFSVILKRLEATPSEIPVASDPIDSYFQALEEAYAYFGFKEDWVVYPFEDYRGYHWKLEGDTEVLFGDKDDVLGRTGNHYEHEIYHQRFYEKWIYRGQKYTMIFVDTHTDGNKFFSVYDNSKELV